eukprot:2647550-Rhodomonas_salina.6
MPSFPSRFRLRSSVRRVVQCEMCCRMRCVSTEKQRACAVSVPSLRHRMQEATAMSATDKAYQRAQIMVVLGMA